MTASTICNKLIADTANAKEIGGQAAAYYDAFVEAVKVVEAAANGERVIKRKYAEATIAIEDFYFFYQDAIISRKGVTLYSCGVRTIAFRMMWDYFKTWARNNNDNFLTGSKLREKINITTDCEANRKNNAPFIAQCEKSAAIWEDFSNLYFKVADERKYKVKRGVKQIEEEKKRQGVAIY